MSLGGVALIGQVCAVAYYVVLVGFYIFRRELRHLSMHHVHSHDASNYPFTRQP